MGTHDHVPRWRRRLRFWGPDVDADVEDELRFHLEMRAADFRARGLPPDEAERAARASFGDVRRVRAWLRAHDHTRQRREARADAMDALLLDLRYALRTLRRQPAFTLAVVLVLGLGIGAATAMFSAVDAALLRPLPFQRDDRLVLLDGVNVPIREIPQEQTSPYLDDVRAERDVFAAVAAYAPGGLNLSGAGAPARLRIAMVTPDLFPTLGVRPALGRGFTAEEGTLDGPRVAVLSDGLWRSQLGGDPAAVGRDVHLNGVPHRVVGVMPPGFGFPGTTELWTPLPVPASFASFEAFRGWLPLHVVARLAPGATVDAATARMTALARRFASEEQARARHRTPPAAEPLRDVLVGSRRTALLVLMGATGLVLLVACANVTNLLLSRAVARRAELALRASLGASRGRIVRQLLVESVVLAAAGGVLGVALAYASLGALGALMPADLAGTVPPRVDGRVLAFSLVVALATGVGFGLWPALGASRASAAETIKAGSGAPSREGTHARRLFVVAELALALVLAVGAALMLRSLQTLLDLDAGVRPESVATLELSLPEATYPGPRQARFYEEVLARLQAMPGVASAAAVNELPLRGQGSISVTVDADGAAPVAPNEMRFAQLLLTSPDYFRTLGIPLRAGRTFSVPYDSARPEVVINETLARTLWPGEDAIGRRLKSFIPGRTGPVVVGVAGDVRARSLESDVQPQMYHPIASSAPSHAALLVRGTAPPSALVRRLRDAVHAVDPTLAVYNVRPMMEVITGAIAPRRANTLLITAFGLVAVALAAIGVYGVVAYAVTRRTREIGIRMALGARRGDVLALFAREGLALAGAGVLLGLAGAWAMRRVVASLLYGIAPGDPVAFAGAALVLLTVAVLATLLPARRALRVDPARTIRVD